MLEYICRFFRKVYKLLVAKYYKFTSMAYLHTPKLQFPLNDYEVNGCKFKESSCVYDGVDWGIHLGEDCNEKVSTQVRTIGRGKVVYSALHPGSEKKRNWGNIIIIAHKNPATRKVFFSLYAHLGERHVLKGDSVELGDLIGFIGKSNTSENGWWKDSHLHFAIYTGPWNGKVLPGYYKKRQHRTKLSDWKNPSDFIENYT